jgi:hypothetical protein
MYIYVYIYTEIHIYHIHTVYITLSYIYVCTIYQGNRLEVTGDLYRPAGSVDKPVTVIAKPSSRRGRDAIPIYDDTDSDDEDRWG